MAMKIVKIDFMAQFNGVFSKKFVEMVCNLSNSWLWWTDMVPLPGFGQLHVESRQEQANN